MGHDAATVAVRKLPVEQHHLVARFVDQTDGVRRGLGDVGMNAVANQLTNNGAAFARIVVDDQNTTEAIGHWFLFHAPQTARPCSLCMQSILLPRS